MRHIDREATILELAAGKRVLHLGAVGYHAQKDGDRAAKYDDTLHAKIAAVASEVVGVDTNTEAVEEYQRAGLDPRIVIGSAEHLETLDLGGAFDVIVSGNVIEHLSNPGQMLDGMRAVSHPGTAVLVTTPHALGLRQYLGHARGRLRESDDHLMTFNAPSLANLMKRHGFEVESVDIGFNDLSDASWRGRALNAFVGRFPRFGRLLVAQARVPGVGASTTG